MSILLLDPSHELVRETSDAESAEFAGDPRHPGETPKVLAIFDDHSNPTMRTEIVPADPEIQEWIPKVTAQIRTSTILDVLEAVREWLVANGKSESAADSFLDDVRAIVDQPKVPEGWTAWGQIPRGSLSSLGDGRWLLIWPEMNERGRDMSVIVGEGDSSPMRVREPEQVFRPDRARAPFVRVSRSGLTAEQIDAFLTAEHPEKFDPEAELAAMFPTSEAA